MTRPERLEDRVLVLQVAVEPRPRRYHWRHRYSVILLVDVCCRFASDQQR